MLVLSLWAVTAAATAIYFATLNLQADHLERRKPHRGRPDPNLTVIGDTLFSIVAAVCAGIVWPISVPMHMLDRSYSVYNA